MKKFMDEDFLLSNDTAKTLYHENAKQMPIVDYHCHIDPKDIYEDVVYANLTQVWLGGDHYKWRAMRTNGIEERYITGEDTTAYEKFEKWAETVPKLIGNPLYHWTHMELKRYFDIDDILSPKTCKKIWDAANERLKDLSVRKIIEKSNVKLICTTDDPIDDLRWHKYISEDETCKIKVLPAFRPDKVLNIDKPGFVEYIKKLGDVCGIDIKTVDDVKAALASRIEFFVKMGCKASDHALDYIVYRKTDENLDAVLQAALDGKAIDQEKADEYKAEILMFCASQYKKHNIVMQLHYGALRNTNPAAFAKLGPDSGFDAICGYDKSGVALGALLGALEAKDSLPKTIIYSLNPTDNALITAIIGCFQSPEVPMKIQHGSAWWFNDTKTGMMEQMTNLANFSILPNFIGMLTDSRSFLSYTRHEYFRRILCDLIGQWVENGEYPADMEILGKMVEDICYNNTVRYFGFEV